MTQVDDKTNLLTVFSNEVVLLEYLYEYFNVFSKKTNSFVSLEKRDKEVTLHLSDNKLVVDSKGDHGNLTFSRYSKNLKDNEIYGYVIWANKQFFDSSTGTYLTFTSRVLDRMMEEIVN